MSELSGHAERMERVRLSLEGLSVGDALGQQFFYFPEYIGPRTMPVGPWDYTDDTVMALGIAEVLSRNGEIEQDDLAAIFARNYELDPARGYGAGAHDLLTRVARGTPWNMASRELFAGSGSFGNGSGMRVPPVGAYFADDLDRVVHEARLSAKVTHAHPEGIAGGIAVAVAAALAVDASITGDAMVPEVLEWTPEGETRDGLARAIDLGLDAEPIRAANVLGSGSEITAMDTVPFVVWSAASSLDDYAEAFWRTVTALGDRDTTCAMVGGIVALRTGVAGIPAEWRTTRESLPTGFRYGD